MSTNEEQPILQELTSRVAALEQAHASLIAELSSARGVGATRVELEPEVSMATATASTQGNFASSNVNIPAVTASGTNGATGVQASSDRGFGVFGQSTSLTGVGGQSTSGFGIEGSSSNGTGVSGQSNTGTGVSGQSNSGLAGEFLGNVSVLGHLSSGAGTFVSRVGSIPAVTASGTIGAAGVQASSDSGTGIVGVSNTGAGISGQSNSLSGVFGQSRSGAGIAGVSNTGTGVLGESITGLAGSFTGNVFVTGNVGIGTTAPADPLQVVTETSNYGITQTNGTVTVGTYVGGTTGGGGFGTKSDHPLSFLVGGSPAMTIATSGQVGINTNPDPAAGLTIEVVSPIGGPLNAAGVVGKVTNPDPLFTGSGSQTAGVRGVNDVGHGVQGQSDSWIGVEGTSNGGTAVYAESQQGIGVWGVVDVSGIGSYAGYFQGNVQVAGKITKAGGGFKIDHPIDPAHKYLNHSFVESSDMKNVYDGVANLDVQGEAVVELPEWFEALNRDFRYQLTAIGNPGPNLYIREEISRNHFKIAGGTPGMKVSWQVTGIRKDAWALEHLLTVEEEKLDKELDHYLHPELYNQPEEKDVTWVWQPEMIHQKKERRQKLGRTGS